MAKGFMTVSGLFSEGDVQPISPAGAGLDVGSNERVYVYMLNLNVKTPGVGGCSVEDGATGIALARIDTTGLNTVQKSYDTSNRTYPARALGVGNSLIVNCQGGQVEVEAIVEVR